MARQSLDPDKHGEPLKYDPDFNGPLKHRSCTDILCFFLLIVFIGCWMGIGIYAFRNGDPNILLVPKDSQNGRCGFDSHLINKPYLFFFDLTKCLNPVPFIGCPTPQVCIKKCPEKVFHLDTVEKYDPNDMICEYDTPIPQTKQQALSLVKNGKCAQWYLPSHALENRCLPLLNKNIISELLAVNPSITVDNLGKATEIITKTQQVGSNVVNDLIKSWWKIAVGLVFALVVCIIYIVLMRWIAGIMVWISIFGVIVILSVCLYFSVDNYKYYKNLPYVSDNYMERKETWLAILILISILLGIILLLLLFLRQRIIIAIALIKESSKAVSSVTSSLFFPIFPWCFQIGVIFYAVIVALYLSTVGTPQYIVQNLNPNTCICSGEANSYKDGGACDPNIFAQNCHSAKYYAACTLAQCHFKGVQAPTILNYLHGANIFGFFWLLFFVSAFSEMVLASVFATWYWTFRKSDVPFFTVTAALQRTLRYHVGTLAFGSLIIAICRMIRVLLEYIESKVKKYENIVTKAIFCCCKCFFWCLEKFLKFINRNAYIMCAIHGKNFCASAKDAFNLLMRNIIRVVVLDKVTDFLIFLSKILVTGGVSSVAYTLFVMNSREAEKLNYSYVPVVVIAIGTFFIATIFFSVFTMAVDTLFLCFLEDSERNDGSQEKPYYMSKDLMQILGKKNK